MTTATTRQNIRRALYDQIPSLDQNQTGLGFAATADTIQTTSITDAFTFANTIFQDRQFRGVFIYRPDLATDDRVKTATTLNTATGALSHGGTAYADTADTKYEIVFLMHPDELNTCIQRAVTRIYYDVQLPLCGELGGTDGDMETTGVTNWAAVGTPTTREKSTTASRVFSGTQVLHVLNDAAAEGAQSTTIRGFPTNGGEWVYVSAVLHADVGTGELHLYDVTNSVSIQSVTSAEEGFVHLWLEAQLPATTEEFAIRLLGTESTADLYWDHVVVYRRERMSLPAPSWLDEQWKFLKLREACYDRTLSTQTQGGYDDATSRRFKDWTQPAHFSLDPLHTDANPYAIQLNRRSPQNELWVQGKRPYSDDDALATEAATYIGPLRLLYAYSKDEIARVLRRRYPKDDRWKDLSLESSIEVEAESHSRPEIPATPQKREYWGRV
jgi:hypothetical protein